MFILQIVQSPKVKDTVRCSREIDFVNKNSLQLSFDSTSLIKFLVICKNRFKYIFVRKCDAKPFNKSQ